jgi:tetratricopeptide (TPR) repeat protein
MVKIPDLSIFDDDLNMRNNIHCHYLLGLGYFGFKDYSKAGSYFKQALHLDPAHLGCITHNLMREFAIKEMAQNVAVVIAQTG